MRCAINSWQQNVL